MTARPLTDFGFPPEGVVFPLESFELRVEEGSHPWLIENEAAIERNWRCERAANPRLFNGDMVFQRELAFDAGRIAGRARMIPYSAFLYWRRVGRPGAGRHLFAAPMIVSSDGAVMMIRMAENTANPGRVYSPAGSLDASDIRNGCCDLVGNMRRETSEETGLGLGDMQSDGRLHALHLQNSVSVLQLFRSELSAVELQSKVALHMDGDPEPEISEMLAIRSPDPFAHDYAPFIPPVLEWIFKEGMN